MPHDLSTVVTSDDFIKNTLLLMTVFIITKGVNGNKAVLLMAFISLNNRM